MIALGTIVNTATVLVGGDIGLVAKKGISERLQTALTKAIGVAVMIVGLSGVLSEMLTANHQNLLAFDGFRYLIFHAPFYCQ